MKRIIFLGLLIASLLFSCTVTEDIHFNEDFSGVANSEIDLSMMSMMMGAADSAADMSAMRDSANLYMAYLAMKISSVDGIGDVDFGWREESSSAYLSYSFEDLDALNHAFYLSNMGEGEEYEAYFDKLWFSRLKFHSPEVLSDSVMADNDVSSMKEFFRYQVNLTFEQGVKKLKSEGATLGEDGNTVQHEGNLIDVLGGSTSFESTIKLK